MSNKFKQNLFAAAAVTLWGSAIPVTKMIGASVSPFGMSAVKCLIAAVLLGAAGCSGLIGGWARDMSCCWPPA